MPWVLLITESMVTNYYGDPIFKRFISVCSARALSLTYTIDRPSESYSIEAN